MMTIEAATMTGRARPAPGSRRLHRCAGTFEIRPATREVRGHCRGAGRQAARAHAERDTRRVDHDPGARRQRRCPDRSWTERTRAGVHDRARRTDDGCADVHGWSSSSGGSIRAPTPARDVEPGERRGQGRVVPTSRRRSTSRSSATRSSSASSSTRRVDRSRARRSRSCPMRATARAVSMEGPPPTSGPTAASGSRPRPVERARGADPATPFTKARALALVAARRSTSAPFAWKPSHRPRP